MRISVFLGKNRGLHKNAARKKKELCSLSSSHCSWHVPRGCQGPSDPLLMPGMLCLSSQGAACPALNCAPMLCSDSWSSAGLMSQGSGRPSASSTRSYRAFESGTGEAGPHCSSQRPLRARLQLLACPASLLLPGLPLPGRNNKPICAHQVLSACAVLWRAGLRRTRGPVPWPWGRRRMGSVTRAELTRCGW